MRVRKWQSVLLVVLLLGIAAALALSFRVVAGLAWQGSPRWQLLYELFSAFIAFEVAAFAISRFGLEARRLPLFIGLAFLGAGIADLVAGLVSQGLYVTPLVGQSAAILSAWRAGRLSMATFLCLGLVARRFWPVSPSARAELVPATIVGGCAAFVLVQLALMLPSAGFHFVIAALLVAALPGYWVVYRQQGGSMVGSVLVSLVLAIFAQAYMTRSATLYDAWFNLASVLKVASYFPPLIGLFVESVVLFRAQKKLTTRLEVAQAELSEYSKGLEKKVAERTQDLESRAKELEAFAYTVSHDLKAPLRGIQTYSQLLAEGYASKLDEQGRRYAESVGKAAANMKQLIDDLLEYSRLERREAQMGPVDLRGLAESVLAERRPVMEQYHTQVELDIVLPAVAGDRAILRQAIANLLDNAIKFSRDAKPPRVTMRGREENGQCVVSISDNGVGFDMQHKERVFEIFQRLHRPEEFEGTGIGLSIVRRAVEKHGGRVWVQAEPGKGATFSFTIPKRGGGA
jgi:signal transduction histidine kinase